MITPLLASTLRVSTPLVFASLGGMFSERSGVINLGLEGMMLVGAFGAAAGAHATHSPWLGALAGMVAGMSFASLYGLCVIQLRANQIIAGTGINMLALGLTPELCKFFYDVSGSTPSLEINERFQSGPIYAVWITVLACWWGMRYSRFGLRVMFAGENPQALEAGGVGVNRVRWLALLLGGALAGLGGSMLSIYLSSSFSREMTAGRGFMALAALIFGKWKPIPTALACLLFGFTEAVQIRLQGVAIWGEEPIPAQFVQIIPYVVTLLVLAGFVGRSRPPKALGIPFHPE